MHSAGNSVAQNRRTRFSKDTAMDNESFLSKPAALFEILNRKSFGNSLPLDSVIAATLLGFLEIHV